MAHGKNCTKSQKTSLYKSTFSCNKYSFQTAVLCCFYNPIYHHLPISLQLKRRISTQGTCQIHRRFPAVVHLRHGIVDCWQPGEWPVEKLSQVNRYPLGFSAKQYLYMYVSLIICIYLLVDLLESRLLQRFVMTSGEADFKWPAPGWISWPEIKQLVVEPTHLTKYEGQNGFIFPNFRDEHKQFVL